MRLLECAPNSEFRLTRHFVGDQIPSYAILSHTWNTDNSQEVTFKDLVDGTGRDKAGFHKIRFCAEQAGRHGLRYFWVDTCCIDKSDSSELQEAINSMFRWYRNAARCYVYLSDVSTTSNEQQLAQQQLPWESAFQASRWFTRGWTLQELIAPVSVESFAREGTRLGDKKSLEQEIHKITGIPIQALQGTPLSQFDIDERFAWANTRQTTREEDWSYCLLGIFDVFIPLIYGEGKEHAVWRLKKAINEAPHRQGQLEGTDSKQGQEKIKWLQSSIPARIETARTEIPPGLKGHVPGSWAIRSSTTGNRVAERACSGFLLTLAAGNLILNKFEEKGDRVLTSFHDLWDILISIANNLGGHEIVCIFDALDECEKSGRSQIIAATSSFYSHTSTPALKFLLTSRPYLDIKRGFQRLEDKLPTIHLSGENEDEVDKISQEIDLVIKAKVKDVPGLSEEEQNVLEEELTGVPNRTYLWVHLVFNVIMDGIFYTQESLRSMTRKLPQSVEEAYDKILSKSRDIGLTRKLLHIVVAAKEPLTIKEMALALAIRPSHRSFCAIELVPEERFRIDVRELCGLFVVVVDSKIYLLHQTAREFLVPSLSADPELSSPRETALEWKYSLRPEESHRILAEICLRRLSLSDSDLGSFQSSKNRWEYVAERTFLGYSAQHWPAHFREYRWAEGSWAMATAAKYCSLQYLVSRACFKLYLETRFTRFKDVHFTPMLAASYLGLDQVVEHLIKKGLGDANAKDTIYERSALSWATLEGHSAVVRRLLTEGADLNAQDSSGHAALHLAIFGCDPKASIDQLLEAGAHVDTKDQTGATPLHLATSRRLEEVVKSLLAAGADPNVKDSSGSTPLFYGAKQRSESIMRQLLEGGADANAKDGSGLTALYYAIRFRHEAGVHMLAKAGADVDRVDGFASILLHHAIQVGNEAIVRTLLAGGANPNAKDSSGNTALHHAAERRRGAIMHQILKGGADVNSRNSRGHTALYRAVSRGHKAVVRRLLLAGADVNAKDIFGKTPLCHVVEIGNEGILHQLLSAGADVNAKDVFGKTPLRHAVETGNEAIVYQLLAAGAKTNAKDDRGRTPLHVAVLTGDETLVGLLLAGRANINARDGDDHTPLSYVLETGNDSLRQLLLAAGAR